MKTHPRRIGTVGASLVLVGAMLLPSITVQARSHSADQVTINYWYAGGGAPLKAANKVAQLFMKTHPTIHVVVTGVPIPSNAIATNQKLMTAVLSGSPPDVAYMDGGVITSWGARNALTAVDPYVTTSGIKPSDYDKAHWDGTQWAGHTWGLPMEDDGIGFLYWNKDLFKKAGLDPEKPPTTIAQLDQTIDKLTIKKNGKYAQIGMIPWLGVGQYLALWGGAFGGSWYDQKTHKITADSPGLVKALTWEVGWAKKLDIANVDTFVSGFTSSINDAFISGHVAMVADGVWRVGSLEQYAPKMHWGISYLPSPDGHKSLYVAGEYVVMPKGSKHPKEAFELMKFMSGPQGIVPWSKDNSYYPSNVAATKDPYFNRTPARRVITSLLPYGYSWPSLPMADLYWDTMTRAEDQARHLKISPQAALAGVSTQMQPELQKYIH